VRALRIKDVTSLLLGEEGEYIPDMNAGVEAELEDCCNCTICMCWILCNGRDHLPIGWDRTQRNLPLSVTAHADKGIAHYEHGGDGAA